MKNKYNIDLEKDKIKSVLKTPEGYFQSLEHEILQKTILEKKRNSPWLLRTIGIAASLLLFMGLYIVFIKHDKPKIQLTEVSTLEILEQEDLELTSDDFLSLVSMEDLNTLQEEIKESTANLDDEELEDYDIYDEI